VIVWVYHPKSDIIQIHENHSHTNKELTEFLFKGTGQSDSGSRFDLPYCATSHPYRILKMAVIGECYAKLQVEGKEDPKTINQGIFIPSPYAPYIIGSSFRSQTENYSREDGANHRIREKT